MGGKVKELQLFNMYLPIFQGTISNWTVDSKAVSWTDVGYSFIISASIKQIKGLELILSVSSAFVSLEQLMIKAYSIICETWSSVIMSCMASVALGYCCLVMMRQNTEVFSDDET